MNSNSRASATVKAASDDATDVTRTAAKAGVDYESVDRCTPVGHKGVSMILSAFALTSEIEFNELSRKDRHHVRGSKTKKCRDVVSTYGLLLLRYLLLVIGVRN